MLLSLSLRQRSLSQFALKLTDLLYAGSTLALFKARIDYAESYPQ